MNIIQYKISKKYRLLFNQLINKIYTAYPKTIKDKVKEYYNNFNLLNPSLKYFDFISLFLFNKNDPLGHISVIIDKRLNNKIGFIGHFECLNNKKYANILINEACKILKQKKRKKIIGPINFSIWQNFRFSVGNKSKPYELEPFSAAYYCKFFEYNKFKVYKINLSKKQPILKSKYFNNDSCLNEKNNAEFIFKIEPFKKAFIYKKQLREIVYQTFKDENKSIFLKINQKEFDYIFKNYTKGNKYFICFCFKKKKIIGFCFFAKDGLSHQKSIVIKTMGVLPSFRRRNVGNTLLWNVAKFAQNIEFKNFIYSTIGIDNVSSNKLSGTKTNVIRKYYTYIFNN